MEVYKLGGFTVIVEDGIVCRQRKNPVGKKKRRACSNECFAKRMRNC